MAWFVLNPSSLSISSPGGAEASLRIDCSDETLSEQLRSRSSREKYSSPGRRMEYCHCSLSGMMSRLSDPITRNARNISKDSDPSGESSALQEDSPARISPSQGKAEDWKERAQGYGLRCSGSLARYDRATSSWRTAQCSLFEDSTECLETLPNWGMTRDGELSELTILERPIEESASGSGENRRKRHIPTPTVMDSGGGYRKGRSMTKEDNFRGVSLKWLVKERPDKFWPEKEKMDE